MHEYYEWLLDKVCENRSQRSKYSKLLWHLYTTHFNFIHPMDANRESEGMYMRYIYAQATGNAEPTVDYIPADCASVLEVLVALADNMEEIMYDLQEPRTYIWFWRMIKSLGLHTQMDDVYDEDKVDYILNRWMQREYNPSTGEGGLYTFRNPQSRDLREVEIWCLAMWYLTEVVNYES